MKLKKKPVTGMKDILPQEMRIRNWVLGMIQNTYASFGFNLMETPCVEHMENLCSKQGGDNEKLIFKILKRGEKLQLDQAETENDLTDCGLRYDLTLPLARYYANHAEELPSPFLALQMGNVWRADRPQRGRYRQFMQCDIDILGESSHLAEIQLILATTSLLDKLQFANFDIRINDRRILKAMAACSGFDEAEYESVFITLDKMDKIGIEGIRQELEEKHFEKEKIETYLSFFETGAHGVEGVRRCQEKLEGYLETTAAQNLIQIMEAVEEAKEGTFTLRFDPTLVRGMSYYTGTIFEIAMPEFGGSVGGGGRYDEMIGKFTGQNIPAVGFSIGFERIVMLLLERNFQVPAQGGQKAYLLEKGISDRQVQEILCKAKEEREQGESVLLVQMKKNKKYQKEQLAKQGYQDLVEIYKTGKEV